MGGMGRRFDGGYAEFTLVPASQVQLVRTEPAWDVPGAMLQIARGSLFRALRPEAGERLLIRDGSWIAAGRARRAPA